MRKPRVARAVDDPRYQQLLSKLRTARLEAGHSQERAARALGKHQSFVSKCESGERRVDPIELQDFAQLYGKPLDYFLADAGAD